MAFLLSTQNVIDYLVKRGLCQTEERLLIQIRPKSSKNFNLLVSFLEKRHLLVKQEPRDRHGNTDSDFAKEWRVHQWLENYPGLRHIRSNISEAIDFDPEHSIIIFNYLDRYCDLSDFYEEHQIFPTAIATSIGVTLANIHRSTLNCQEYKDFLFKNSQKKIEPLKYLIRGLEEIKPEIFGQITKENLTFFKLYQRYKRFGEAIADLKNAYQCCCLIHKDLKLDNILLHLEWEKTISHQEPIVRIIDWELFAWGDPGYDLGSMLANYLKIWLRSLTVSADIDLETALHLATTPLELLQPSLVALTKAYFANFPEIVELRPDFCKRVVQFIGLALLRKVWLEINYHEPFNNSRLCMLQVAKTLLCDPEQSVPTIFGTTTSELIGSSLVHI
jgi:hypothetical protein